MGTREQILDELMQTAPFLAGAGSDTPYVVPPGYFDDLAGIVLSKIRALETGSAVEELEALSPLLGSLKKQVLYSLPDGYFDTIISPESSNHKQAIVKQLPFRKNIFRYAAAAIITGLIVMTAWFMIKPSTNNNTLLAHNSDVSVQKVLLKVQNIPDDEIENYIDGSLTVFNYDPANGSVDIRDEDVRLMLTDISDKELENYLN